MARRPSVARIVIGTYRENRWRFLIGVLALFLGTSLGLLVPKYTGIAVDSIRQLGALRERGRSDLFNSMAENIAGLTKTMGEMDRITRCLIFLLVFSVIAAIFAFAKRLMITGLSRRVEFNLRQSIFGHLHKLPMSFFTRNRSGDVISRATSDVESVRMMTGPAVMYLTEAAVLLPLALLVMWLVSPTLMLWALLPLGLLTVSTLYFSPRQRVHSTDVQERQGELSARAQENFSGVRVVKAFNRQDFESEAFDEIGKRVYDSQIALARNRAAFHASIWTLNGVGLLIFLYVGGQEVAAGRATLGELLEFWMYFTMLYWPMIALGWVVALVIRGRVSARRINELFEADTSPGVVESGATPRSLDGELAVKGLTFAYEEGKSVLSDVGFSVRRGETLGVIGPVGCGKSTLAELLLRLHELQEGEITVDGRPLAEYDPRWLRAQIGYVPQETFLFSESIGNNIAFGLEESESNEIESAAGIAQLRRDVEEFPNRFDTLLGERGVNLSGGQKQRAAIARALIKKPPIVILDDCLSAVDTKTEEAILRGLRRELENTTSIIIAQRVSAIVHADEIIVLDAGRIVERGTDEELRNAGGLYAEMAERQSLVDSLSGSTRTQSAL